MVNILATEAFKVLRDVGYICEWVEEGVSIKSHNRPGQFVRESIIKYTDNLGSLVSKEEFKRLIQAK